MSSIQQKGYDRRSATVLDLIFFQVKLSDALSFAIDKDLPLSQNEKTLYRSTDYYTNLSNQKFLSRKNILNKCFKETLAKVPIL